MMTKGDVKFDSPSNPEKEAWGVKGFEPSYATFTPIPHYYGDIARGLLLGASALLLLAAPLYTDELRTQFPFMLVGVLVAVAAAAFTDPHKKIALMADAVVAGSGTVLYGSWAFIGYDAGNSLAFMLRIVIAVLFLLAFYFSMKTVRAFALHEIGRQDRFGVVEEYKGEKNQ